MKASNECEVIALRIKKKLFAWLFGFALLGFTTYLLLDTFVLVRKYTPVQASPPRFETAEIEIVPGTNSDVSADSADADASETVTEPVSTDTTYSDGNIEITLTDYRVADTTVHVADVRLTSAEYLRTALAQNTYGRNVTQTTSAIADSVNAILAINGDYYGAQRSGYVIRGGVLYRSKADSGAEDLVIWRDGSFSIIHESEISAEELLAQGAWDVLSFGPALVQNGEISVSEYDEVGRAMASNPRTAIGIFEDGHYVFIVADGRTGDDDGLTLYELAAFMQSLGVQTGYNLDGGGSSSMVFMGTVINTPTANGRKSGERSVSDIVYIGYGV